MLFACEGAEAKGDDTCPVLGQSRGRSSYEKTARTQRSSHVVQHTVNRGILKQTNWWYMQYVAYQDKWLSDSLPVRKDSTSVREPVEIESNLSQLSRFFPQIVIFAQVATRYHLTVYPEFSLSQ